MLKNIIAPVQAWLLSRGQCVGCGAKLSLGKRKKRHDGWEQVKCKCSRVYLSNPTTNTYRRALMSEVE